MVCDTPVMLDRGSLPKKWVEVADNTVPSGRSACCPSCRRAVATALDPTVFLPGCVAVDEKPPTARLYSGCRIYHWLVGGNAVLRVHGGGTARPRGRDEPIHFLATPDDLTELIVHLKCIRSSLEATGTDA